MPVVLQYPAAAGAFSLKERLLRPFMNESLVVVPTKRRIRHLTRFVLRSLDRPVAPGFPFHTLESLSRSLFSALDTARPIIAGPLQTLLFSEAVESCAPSFRYFRPRGTDLQLFRGTFEKIVESIAGLKESGVSPDLLEQELALAGLDEQHKLRDMVAIFRAFNEELDRMGVADLGGMYKTLAEGSTQEEFTASFRRQFPAVDFVSLAGFDEFTEPEIGFVRKVCGVPGLSVALLFDFSPGNPELFGHLESNYRRFRDLGFAPVTAAGEFSHGAEKGVSLPGEERSPAVLVAERLFRDEPAGKRADMRASVRILRARSRVHEIELICKLIKRLEQERPGRDLSAVCVAMRHPQRYTDIVREQFPKFGIPVNITDRFDLSRSPLVVDLVGAIQIPVRGYRRDDVLRIVRSPYFSLGDPENPCDAGNLTGWARKLRVTAGKQSWYGSFDNAIKRLATRIPDLSDQEDRAQHEREIQALRKARTDFAWLAGHIERLERDLSAADFGRGVRTLCDAFGIPGRLLHGTPAALGVSAEKDVRAYAAFLEILDDMVSHFELRGAQRATYPLKMFVDRLMLAMSRERYNIREQVGEGVLVTSIEETRGLPIDVMILAGMVDGEFPAMYQPEVFLSAERRKQRERRHHWQNRYLFYQAATNWRDSFILTYPEREGELDLVRSPFIDALLRIADVREVPVDDAEHAVLASEEELLRWAALEIPAGKDAVPPELLGSLAEVKHAHAVERSRLGDHRLPEYEGFIGSSVSPAGQAALEQMKLRTYSVTQLETYGKCPFKFFAERLLHLQVPADFEEEWTPVEKGALLHEVLFEFYSRRRDQGRPPLPECSESDFEEAVRDVTALTRNKLDALSIPDPFWEYERGSILGESGGGKGILREFLECERARGDRAVPSYFEAGFGSRTGAGSGRDRLLSREEPVLAGSVKLRGKVDRIDRSPGFFTIIDYKTGRDVPRLDDIREGMSLQLPLYLYAVDLLLREGGEGPPGAAGLYYHLRTPVHLSVGLGNGGFAGEAFPHTRASQLLKTEEEFRGVIDDAIRLVGDFVRKISGGSFPLTSTSNIDRVCVSCGCSTMCRIQTLRHVQTQQGEDA